MSSAHPGLFGFQGESSWHRVEVEVGTIAQRVMVKVDGVVVARRGLEFTSQIRGTDIPLNVDRKAIIVQVRTDPPTGLTVREYRFGLAVEGAAPMGATMFPAMPLKSNEPAGRSGPRTIEGIVWAASGGVVIALTRQGANPLALLFPAAPLACSLVVRQSSLSTRAIGLTCLAIEVGAFVIVAWIGVAIGAYT
jgi:hypothetical protein